MLKALVNIYVSLFVFKKHDRAYKKYRILGFFNRVYVNNMAKYVGKNLDCSGQNRIQINKNTSIGDNVTINGLIMQGTGKVNIGSYVHFGIDCIILTDNHNYEGDLIPFDNKTVSKTVEIGDFVWIGTRVTILPGTKIGEGAIIQAGAVVHGEIPPYAIAGGNPAKVFKYRDVEHFKELKDKECFLVRKQ